MPMRFYLQYDTPEAQGQVVDLPLSENMDDAIQEAHARFGRMVDTAKRDGWTPPRYPRILVPLSHRATP